MFCSYFKDLDRFESVTDHRLHILATYRSTCEGFNATMTCLSCYLRGVDVILPCGHPMCDTCVRTWGSRNAEHSFELPNCILCGQSINIAIRCLPATATPTVLTLDGGGIRGITSLKFLHELEKRLKGNIWRFFDLAVGTSTGEY